MATLTENVQKVIDATAALKTSIAAKGVEIPVGSKLSALPALVDKIKTGGEERQYNLYSVCFDGTSKFCELISENTNSGYDGDWFQINVLYGGVVRLPDFVIPRTISPNIIVIGRGLIELGADFFYWPIATEYRCFGFGTPQSTKTITADGFSKINTKKCIFTHEPRAKIESMKNYPWGAPKGTIFQFSDGTTVTI